MVFSFFVTPIAMPPTGLCFAYVTFLNIALLFVNGWKDRNADCRVNTVDGKNNTSSHLVNFGPVTPEIL